jgi:hypothetical protein
MSGPVCGGQQLAHIEIHVKQKNFFNDLWNLLLTPAHWKKPPHTLQSSPI